MDLDEEAQQGVCLAKDNLVVDIAGLVEAVGSADPMKTIY